MIGQQRQKLLTELAKAEQERQAAADALAAADDRPSPAGPGDCAPPRPPCPTSAKARARIETRLEGARTRRQDEAARSANTEVRARGLPRPGRASRRGAELPALDDADRHCSASRPTASASAASTCRPTTT